MSYRITTSIGGGIAAVLLALGAGTAQAEDISARKMAIKDHSSDPAKRQVQVQSKDAGVLYSEAVDPDVEGATVRVYSASDDQCFVFAGGANWDDNGKRWKYKDDSKNQIQIADEKLQVKIRSGITFDLADDHPQDAVNVQVQIGETGVRYCLRCNAPTKDEEFKFQAKDCAAAACDVESLGCAPGATTTTTTTTTMPPPPPTEVMGALPSDNGKFAYLATPGVPGADALCEMEFVGTHACSYTELLIGEGAGDLIGLQSTNSQVVTSLWSIDAAAGAARQCNDSGGGGSGLDWDYATAHTGDGGDFVNLDNGTGDLGTLNTSNTACGASKWVGCCKD